MGKDFSPNGACMCQSPTCSTTVDHTQIPVDPSPGQRRRPIFNFPGGHWSSHFRESNFLRQGIAIKFWRDTLQYLPAGIQQMDAGEIVERSAVRASMKSPQGIYARCTTMNIINFVCPNLRTNAPRSPGMRKRFTCTITSLTGSAFGKYCSLRKALICTIFSVHRNR